MNLQQLSPVVRYVISRQSRGSLFLLSIVGALVMHSLRRILRRFAKVLVGRLQDTRMG